MKFPGRATAVATREAALAAGIEPAWVRELGPTGLSAAAVGFGCYRIGEAVAEHGLALDHALRRGVRLVDTSVNYGLGAAERAVGAAIERGLAAGRLTREGVIVVTKVGYWQGELLEWLRGSPHWDPRALATLSDEHTHALSPPLIRHAVDVSRRRLGLQTLDVVLLHNPEYLLAPGPDALRDADDDTRRAAFEATILEAFRTLEALVREGVIAWYGVSSNTLGAEVEAPNHTTVAAFVRAAEAAAGLEGAASHHLAVTQAPLNLLEPRGLEAAAESARHGLAFLGNRPLNAIVGGALVRLASPGDTAARDALGATRRALRQLEHAVAAARDGAFPRWSDDLPETLRRTATALDFDDFLARFARPRTEAALSALSPAPGQDPGRLAAWRLAYRDALDAMMGSARAALAHRDAERLETLTEDLDRQLPPELADSLSGAPLSRRALAYAATRPGASVALCGMRRRAWVDDALALVASPDAPA
jgi:aryl-alcohol dehydrogenase-like predicted oxidoreductase